MAKHELRYVLEPSGYRFVLRRRGTFRLGGHDASPEEWGASAHPGAVLMARLIEHEVAEVERDSVLVGHAAVASMPISDARLLGLPPECPFALRLNAVGALADPGFRIGCTWLDHDGIEAVGFTRTQTILRSASSEFVVLNPLCMLLDDVDAINAACEGDHGRSLLDARMVLMAQLKMALSLTTGDARAGEYLTKLTIHHATGLGIDVVGGADNERFAPILFGNVRDEEVTDTEQNEDRAPGQARLLPKQHAATFAETLFPHQGARSHYRLSDGVYAVVDASVEAALRVIQRVNASPAATRAAFRADPRSFLIAEIEKEGGTGGILCGGAVLDDMRDYGERVLGVVEWSGKKLSFKLPVYQKWFPDGEGEVFTIDVPDGQPLVLRPEEVSALRDAIDCARSLGHAEAEFRGRSLAATSEMAETVHALTGRLAPDKLEDRGAPGKKDASKRRTLVLRVAENEEDLVFNAKLRDPEGRLSGAGTVNLKTSLYPHQVEGVSWLKSAYLSGMPGVLLADDMGLGKTLQVLAFLAWVRSSPRNAGQPILIVAPSKLLDEWLEQLDGHLGSMALGRLVKAYDKNLDALRVRKAHEGSVGSHTLDVNKLQGADWILTTYETLRDYHFSFGKIRFRIAVFDEAQKIKSMTSRMNYAAKSQQPDFAIIMTGTPVENELADLWTLLDVCWPGFLGTSAKEFVKIHGDEGSGDARRLLKSKLIEPGSIGGRHVPPIMLRRFKSDILTSLPKRHEPSISEPMPDAQFRKYDAILAQARRDRWPSLKTLAALRTVSLHPDLRTPTGLQDCENLIGMSARFRAAFEILAAVRAKGERALIFVDLIRAQTMVADLIRLKFGLSRTPRLINGETAGKDTNRIKREFQEGRGFDVLILGPKAAGFGLNLTAANHVIHLSRWWNPAVEDQCSDRVYRIGQDKEVTIHVPRAIHPVLGDASFDLVLDAMLVSKRALSREIIVPTMMRERDFMEMYRRVAALRDGETDVVSQIDANAWRHFEQWTGDQFRKAGFQVHFTPRVGDGGADLIMRPPSSSRARSVICQCKHRSDGERGLVDDAAVSDVLRALPRYLPMYPWLREPILMAVTNARFDLAAERMAEEKRVTLVARSQVGTLVEIARHLLTAD